MSSLKEKAKTLMDMMAEAELKCWFCSSWDACSKLRNEGKDCDIRNPLVVKLEDVEQTVVEIKQKVSKLKEVISQAPYSELNRRALWIIKDIEKCLEGGKNELCRTR
jgi:hypothetical protein